MAVEVKIDHKHGPNETGEKQAREHYLGRTLRTTHETVASAITIRIPHRFRTMPRDEIRENLEASDDFGYALCGHCRVIQRSACLRTGCIAVRNSKDVGK